MNEQADTMEELKGELVQTAWLASEFWYACRDAGVPRDLAAALARDWHSSWLIEYADAD